MPSGLLFGLSGLSGPRLLAQKFSLTGTFFKFSTDFIEASESVPLKNDVKV